MHTLSIQLKRFIMKILLTTSLNTFKNVGFQCLTINQNKAYLIYNALVSHHSGLEVKLNLDSIECIYGDELCK